jgi:uncharacterized membrane protein YeaQ/YmgE (transglycosylase-associated protein family)
MKVLWLVIGLVVGGLAGYLTRPQAAELKVAGVSIEVQGNHAAGASGGSLTTGQSEHIAIFAVVGALIGLGIGFVADRRRA